MPPSIRQQQPQLENASASSENSVKMVNTPNAAFQPTILQASTSIAFILSIVAYLVVPRGGRSEGSSLDQSVTEQVSSANSWFPYIFLLGFLFNVSLNLLLSPETSLQSLMDRLRKKTPSPGMSRASRSSEALSRLARVSSGATLKRISQSICSKLHSYNRRIALQALTRKECFAKLNYIEQLSVEDVAVLYRYATEINQPDFNKAIFKSEQSKLVRAILTATDMAVSMSRGGYGEPSLTETRKGGDVDALYFVAATRIFIEWRALRNVPKGYQRYAVALNLAYRDVLQNLVKIELGVHSYLNKEHHQHHDVDKSSIPSPTVRQLLEYERISRVHPKLPRLNDKSASAGLLWAKRQMHYHTLLISNALDVPAQYTTLKDAATSAYHEVYGNYHGWTVQKVFTHSLGGSPPLDVLWKEMDPPVSTDFQTPGQPSTSAGKADFLMRKLTDVSEGSSNSNRSQPTKRRVNVYGDDNDSDDEDDLFLELERLGMHVAERWDDLLRYFRCVKTERHSPHSNNLLIPSENYEIMKRKLNKASLRALNESIKGPRSTSSSKTRQKQQDQDLSDDDSITSSDGSESDPIQKVREGATNFVTELLPFLNDLGGLVDELNMNDPTKV